MCEYSLLKHGLINKTLVMNVFSKFSQKNIFNCDQMGIISPVAGFGGIMQAITVIDIILGCKNSVYKN